MKKTTLNIFILLCILFIATIYPQGRTIGIFVDGSYSPGKKDTDMDKLIDKRIKDAMDAMKSKDSTSETGKIEHKDDLIRKLEGLHCGCGDEIVLYMAGHGEDPTGVRSNPAFHFTKDGTEIRPDELRRALQKAADTCCCKINVVMFSCFSGNFLNELFNDPHVVSVFVSSSSTEKSYTDAYTKGGVFVDGGDWAGGFDEDWKASKKKKIVEVLIESAESAKEKMPDKFAGDEHPQGWVRGEFEIYGHIEGIRKDEKGEKIVKLKVHFYEPDFLKCSTKEIKVDGVDVPATIKVCSWIRDTVRTGKPTEPIVGISGVTETEPPVENILAHVESVDRDRGIVTVHVISPKSLHCKKKIKVKIEKPGTIDPALQFCNWIQINIKVIDPPENETGEDGKFSTSDNVKAKDQTFNCHIHIDKLDRVNNLIDIHILAPPWLKCQIHKNVPIPEGERNRLDGLDKCENINADITIHPNGTVDIRNISALTNAEGSKRFSLDAAVQNMQQLNVDTSGTLYPELNVTNVGEETISFPVFVAVAKLGELNLLQQWWQTGKGTPQCLWYDMVEVADLSSAQTRTIDFMPWEISSEEDKYWVGFRTGLVGDENPASDTTSTFLTLRQSQQNTPSLLQNPIVQPLAGTIQTPFVYQVIYIDLDGDEPASAEVIIDNQSFQLIAGQGTITEGKMYYMQTNLEAGLHSFYFSFDDGHGNIATTEVMNGPNVQ